MYNIQVVQQPHKISFTKNDMLYRLGVFPYTSNEVETNTHLVISVYATSSDEPLKSFDIFPDANGVAFIDVSKIVHSYLQFFMPNISVDHSLGNATLMNGQYCAYKISIRLVNDYESLTFNDDVSIMHTDWLYACKGGLDDAITPTHFIHKLIKIDKSFLNFNNEVNLWYHDAKQWITAIAVPPVDYSGSFESDATGANLKLIYTDYYIHKTDEIRTIEPTLKVKMGELFSIPVLPIDNDDTLTHFDIEVYLTFGGNTWMLSKATFYKESVVKPTNYIYYHNSVGGLSILPLLSAENESFEYNKSVVTRINKSLYISKNVVQHDVETLEVLENYAPSFTTPMMTLTQLQAIRDVYFANVVWLQNNNIILPYHLVDDALELVADGQMYAVTLQLNSARVATSYTPQYLITEFAVCEKPQSLVLSQEKGGTLSVQWTLPENVYMGELYLHSTIHTVGPIKLTTRGGKMSFSNLIFPFDDGQYIAYASIRSQCSATSFSPFYISDFFTVKEFLPPFVPNLYAVTYSGEGNRKLTFTNGLDKLTEKVVSLNVGSWIRQVMFDESDIDTFITTGTAGGTFIRGTSVPNPLITYAPPAADFVGVDILEYYVHERNIETFASTGNSIGKLYVTVGSGMNNIHTSNVGVAVYVKITFDSSDTYYVPSAHGIFLRLLYYTRTQLRFYSDPYGLKPYDVTELGLNITLRSIHDDYMPYDDILVVGKGNVMDIGYLPTRIDNQTTGKSEAIYWQPVESSDYYII